MLDWIHPALGFVSASLVAVIALFFGAMFLFFSGSAALVLGQFLHFSRPLRVAGPAVALTVAAVTATAVGAGVEPWFLPPLAWGVLGAVCWLLLRLPRVLRVARWVAGVILLSGGVLYVVSLGFVELAGLAQYALASAVLLLVTGGAGFAPLILAGLIEHRRERPVEWYLSFRYLVAKRRQTFISVITIICVLGVALGVAVITVVLSVMNGFARTWESKIAGNRAHFVVQSRLGPIEDYEDIREQVLQVPGVTGATPFLVTDAVVRSPGGSIRAVMLKGIDPATVGEATDLPDDLIEGSLSNLDPEPGAEGTEALPGLIIGFELANQLLLRVGDPMLLIAPLGGPPTPLGPAPRLERFRVAGVFKSDFFQFDETYLYASLAGARKFMKVGRVVTGIEVRSVDAYRSRAIGQVAEAALGGLYYARDWKEFYPGFFQALKMERAMMFVLLSFIMVVAGFIIVATLIMMIMEKARDIAILKAMGCDDDGVLRIFAIGGVLIGISGLALGLGMGLVITWNLDLVQSWVERALGFDVLPGEIYQLQSLPFYVEPLQLASIALIAMVLSIGATLLPSWQASRLDPAEALRYE